jgi:hypothetical protein
MKPEDFEPWVGRTVRVATVPAPTSLVLVGLERRPWRSFDFREPFVMYFESPEAVYLLDATYEFDCGRGGPYAIHISQLKSRPGWRRYQAVFN